MTELTLGSRVRAIARITNGYGEGQRVVEPGFEGTVRSFSRAKSYPMVEWDAGWQDICRPEQVQVLDPPRKITSDDVGEVIRQQIVALNGSSTIAVSDVVPGPEGALLVRLRNGQVFTVMVREGLEAPHADEDAHHEGLLRKLGGRLFGHREP